MSAPAIVIRFPFEGCPQVWAEWLTDGDEKRLTAWLESHPAWHAFVEIGKSLAQAAAA